MSVSLGSDFAASMHSMSIVVYPGGAFPLLPDGMGPAALFSPTSFLLAPPPSSFLQTYSYTHVPRRLIPPAPAPAPQDMEITLLEALVGFRESIVHLDGRSVDVTAPVPGGGRRSSAVPPPSTLLRFCGICSVQWANAWGEFRGP